MREIMQIRGVFKKHLKKPRKIYSKMRYMVMLENNQFMTIVCLYHPIIVQLGEKSHDKLTSNLFFIVHRFHGI